MKHRNVPKLQNQPKMLQCSQNQIEKGGTMAKIKEELLRIQEQEYEAYVSFMEWVCDQKHEMSDYDVIKEEEEDPKEPSTPRTSIVHHNNN